MKFKNAKHLKDRIKHYKRLCNEWHKANPDYGVSNLAPFERRVRCPECGFFTAGLDRGSEKNSWRFVCSNNHVCEVALSGGETLKKGNDNYYEWDASGERSSYGGYWFLKKGNASEMPSK